MKRFRHVPLGGNDAHVRLASFPLNARHSPGPVRLSSTLRRDETHSWGACDGVCTPKLTLNKFEFVPLRYTDKYCNSLYRALATDAARS